MMNIRHPIFMLWSPNIRQYSGSTGCKSSRAVCQPAIAKGDRLGKVAKVGTARSVARMPARSEPRKNRLRALPRILSCEPIIHGVLKIVWNDGFEGVVDLRPTIDRGGVFAFLRDPENLIKVRVSDYGHSIYWINDKGEEIDFGADNLRSKAENQAKLHKLVANMHV
jgi:hypothetical protein